ncbi:MAG: type II secretion system GspH family protein [Candidatus Muirbacterium halophilum]|nr:type II secretion system GspH family protein [Candidatus Muirbacterium halophilum]MCK9476183.1 type II secretion system GspH family protein [Candidatus Muirbacterium halophilum]
MFIKKKAFTIVELLISISIMLLLVIIITSSFGQNILNFKLGNEINDASYARFFMTKELYYNMINLNNKLSFLNNSLENREFNFLYMRKKNNDNKYSKIDLKRYSLYDFGKETLISYYFEGSSLIKEINGKKRVLISNLDEFSFDFKDKMLKCKGILNAKTKTGKKILPFEFAVWTGSLDIGVKYE